MTPALFWTLVLVAGAFCALVVGARRLRRLLPAPDGAASSETDSGTGTSLGERLAALRDRIAASRPVNLESLPEKLAGEAIRAARPVPGGRLVAVAYQVRCGTGLYGAAAPYAEELQTAFVTVLRECSAPQDLPDVVRIRFVYDETLASQAYRLDMEFPHESPTTMPSGTVIYVPPARYAEPEPDALESAETVTHTPLSWWTLVLAHGVRYRVPASGTYVVGADPTCDVVVDEAHVSSHHLRLRVEDERLVLRDGAVTDLGDGRPHVRPSTNGTFLRDHPISTVRLSPGTDPASLRLGPVANLTVEYVDPAATQPMLAAVVDLSSTSRGGRR